MRNFVSIFGRRTRQLVSSPISMVLIRISTAWAITWLWRFLRKGGLED